MPGPPRPCPRRFDVPLACRGWREQFRRGPRRTGGSMHRCFARSSNQRRRRSTSLGGIDQIECDEKPRVRMYPPPAAQPDPIQRTLFVLWCHPTCLVAPGRTERKRPSVARTPCPGTDGMGAPASGYVGGWVRGWWWDDSSVWDAENLGSSAPLRGPPERLLIQ